MNDRIDKSSLLDSLKIERSAPVRRRRSRALLLGAAGVGVVAIAAAAWFFWPDNRVPVHVITATVGSGAGGGTSLDASGYVVARRKATLSAKILGKVTEVNFEEGQTVKSGDIVARLDNSNYEAALHQAQALASQAKAAFDNTAPIYTRYLHLQQEGAISTDMVQNERLLFDNARTAYDVARTQVQLAESNLNDTLVRAPFSGVVTVKVAQVGEVVAPSAAGGGDTRTGIVTIVDMDSLEVQVDVSENYIDRIVVGGRAIIHLDSYPDWDIPGAVIAIIPTADQSKGTVQVRVSIKVKDARILPQMAARVSFLTQAAAVPATHSVSVPLDAVQVHGRTGTVYIVGDGDMVEARDVALGIRTGQTVTVLSGLTGGERLASGDLSRLHDGAKVAPQD